MNKKIKIIEILNIISNGEYEKLPLNIEVDGKKYNWDTLEHFYNRKDSDREDLLELAREYDTITFLDMIAEVLDDSVEDNTEEIILTEKIFVPMELNLTDYDKNLINNCFESQNALINQLVRAVNKLRKEKSNDN